MQQPPDTFPSPPPPVGSSPVATRPKPAAFSLDVLDVVLFFVGFFCFVGMGVLVPVLRALPWLGLVLGMGLIGVRHRRWPPKPRTIRPGSTVVGVIVGLSVLAAVVLFGIAGMGLVRLAEREPDWASRRAAYIIDLRRRSQTLNLPELFRVPLPDAHYERLADEEIARQRQQYVADNRDTRDASLKLSGVGALLLGLASLLERVRTRPVDASG